MPKIRPVTGTAVAAAVAFFLTYCMLGSLVVKHGMHGDFATLYSGAALAHEGHFDQLYDYEAEKAFWKKNIDPDVPVVPYTRPPFYALEQSVIGFMPLKTAFTVCIVVSLVLIIGFLVWAGRQYGEEGLMLAAMCMPSLIGLSHGQDTAIVLTLLTAGYWLKQKGHDGWAGAVFGLVLFKFHLLIGLALALLAARQWRMLRSFAAVGLAEAAVSVALIGVNGIRPYIEFVQRADQLPPHPAIQKMPNLAGLCSNLGLMDVPVLVGVLALMVVAAAMYAARTGPWWCVYLAGMAASLLISPHIFLYDLGILLPALPAGYFFSKSKWTRAACVLLCSPVPYMAGFSQPPLPLGLPLSTIILLGALVWEARLSARSQTDNDAGGLAHPSALAASA